MLTRLLIGLVVLALLAFLAIGFVVDRIAKAAVEEGGELALGVPTKVDSASIGFFSQSFTLEGLSVSNPKGYGSTNFLELDRGSVEVAVSSLMSDEVDVPNVELDGIRISLVQGAAGSNYDVILESLERFQNGPSDDAEGKRFVIRKLVIKRAEVIVVPVPELDLVSVSVPLGDIELRDIGTGGDEAGVDLAGLMGIVVEAVLGEASASG